MREQHYDYDAAKELSSSLKGVSYSTYLIAISLWWRLPSVAQQGDGATLTGSRHDDAWQVTTDVTAGRQSL